MVPGTGKSPKVTVGSATSCSVTVVQWECRLSRWALACSDSSVVEHVPRIRDEMNIRKFYSCPLSEEKHF